MKPRKTHKQFIEEVDIKYPNRSWKILSTYTHNKTPLYVQDSYGICLITPNTILVSSTPNIKTAIDKDLYIVNKFIDVWKDAMFDYSEFEYKGVKVKSTLICRKEGHRFLSDANNHLSKRGCPQCAKDNTSERVRSNTKEFVEKAVTKYGEKDFSFDKTDYKSAIEEVVITCNKHLLDFKQSPNRFLNGSTCPKCQYNKNDNFHTYKKKRNKSILYIIECWDENERFIKIGVTSRTVKSRFKDNFDMPYNYKVLKEFQYANIDTPFGMETKLLSFTKPSKYFPKMKFSGVTESRNLNIKKPLLEYFDVCADFLYYTAFLNFAETYSGVFNIKILNSGDYSKLEIETVMKGYEIYQTLTFN